jgi:hypothetical protein
VSTLADIGKRFQRLGIIDASLKGLGCKATSTKEYA